MIFNGRPARKDPSRRYSRFRVPSPPCILKNRGKKGARSGGGRRMSAGLSSSLVGAYQHSGCYTGIYMPMKLLPPSVTVLTYLSTAVCFVRTDRLGESTTPLHPPNGTHDHAFARCSRLCEFSRLSHESDPPFFFLSPFRPVFAPRIEFAITFFLSNASARVSQRGTDNTHE